MTETLMSPATAVGMEEKQGAFRGWSPIPERLVCGRGRYVANITPSGTLHLAVVRSQHAHALLRKVDLTPALDVPGVVAVFGPEDGKNLPPLPILSVTEGQKASGFPVFFERALYVGQPLGFVAAESRYAAEDGVEAAIVEYEPLPAVHSIQDALEPDAPLLHPEWGTNVAAQTKVEAGNVEAALGESAFVLEKQFRIPRAMGIPMECRGIVAQFDRAAGRLTVYYSTQAPEPFRMYLAAATGLPEDRIHIIVPDVGGGFGNKLHYFPEDVVACLLAVRTGRPVKYMEDRREHFVATVHSREQSIRVRAGFHRDGRLIALDADIAADMGAHLHTKGNAPGFLTARLLPGPYQVEHYRVNARAVVTNKTPSGAYRGFGQPQAVFVHERLMDMIAAQLGIDPAEVRRRNLVQSHQFPYKTAAGLTYDSGDYVRLLDELLAFADYEGLRRRQREARREGRLFGIGLATLVELTSMGPSRLMGRMGNRQGGYETALVRIYPSGRIACYTGVIEIGQGTRGGLARLCANHFGVDPAYVNVYMGDTDAVPFSFYGTAASRGMTLAGAAVVQACRELQRKIRLLAAHWLKTVPDDVEIEGGNVRSRTDPDRGLTLAELALEAWRGQKLPDGMEPGLEAKAIFEPSNWVYSSQAHLVTCEVDRVTGRTRLEDYFVVHDCGTIVDTELVEGQIRGGIAQGIGAALMEEVVYDRYGQLLTGTFMDYWVPTAVEIPRIRIRHIETPSPLIPGGMKGVGEGGLIGANAAVVNAVLDAMAPAGADCTTFPMTPSRVKELLDRHSTGLDAPRPTTSTDGPGS